MVFDMFDILAFSHFATKDQAFQTQNMPQDALLDTVRRAKVTPSTKTPKNQLTNPQTLGVGPAECAERLN